MKKIMLIFMLLFQSNFLLSMSYEQFFMEELFFNEADFLNPAWNNDFFLTHASPDQNNPISTYKEKELPEEETITQVRKEHSNNSNSTENAEELLQENNSFKTRKPSRSSRPKMKCNYPKCSLTVAKNRFKDHLIRAHSKCPWCNFEGSNRKELIEHLLVIKSDKHNKNHCEAVYFCLSCMNFVTTYYSDFKKHGCRNKKIILLHQE